MASKLEDAKADLGVTADDLDRLRKRALGKKILTRALALLTPLIAFIAGFAAAGGLNRANVSSDQPSSYPFVVAAASAFHYKAFSAKTRFTIFGTVVVSIIALTAGYVLGGDSVLERDKVVVMYGVLDGESMDNGG